MSISATEGPAGTPYAGPVVGTYTGANGATAGANTSTGMSGAGDNMGDQMNKDLFLKLMVAQLRNQDPMNPTDSSQFLSQTAQFTSLEKLDAVAQQTASALTAQMAFGASGLVGRTVTYTDPVTKAETTGAVTSVRFTSSGPLLGVDGTEVQLGNVTEVAG